MSTLWRDTPPTTRPMPAASATTWVLPLVALSLGCDAAGYGSLGERALPIIYGRDDRQELYQVATQQVRELVEQSVVALVPANMIVHEGTEVRLEAPLRSQLDMVCDEPFTEQPAAAICTGVLVDWDLILTAGHCAHALPLEELVAVFGYYYSSASQLALSASGVFPLADVVADRVERVDGVATRDYAFLRLARAVSSPYRPAPIRVSALGTELGAPLTYSGASEGAPIKVDLGAVVHDSRRDFGDYFVADTDSARGGSGGGAFDQELALLGVLFRGGVDRVVGRGCLMTNRVSSDQAEERFGYASDALADLCDRVPNASSLCRPDCGDPCAAMPPAGQTGCALRATRAPGGALAVLMLLVTLLGRCFIRPRRGVAPV